MWNYVSIAIMAVSGALMNAVIAFFYDSSTLGIFNETYAWYMIISQITVWGIHMSVLKYVPEQDNEKKKRGILKSAVFITLLLSLCIVVLCELILIVFPGVIWKRSLQVALTGLISFSMNKVLLSYLNAIYELVMFAVFQSLRYLGLSGIIFLLAVNRIEGEYISLVFPMVEGGMSFLILFFLFTRNEIRGHFNVKDARELFLFGTKILPSNMVVEMNTKVDVVCLGFLIKSTSQIGIYSFAILFTEGFYMLFMTVRKVINPGISEFNANGRLKEYVANVSKKLNLLLWPVSLAAYILILTIYYFICRVLVGTEYNIGIFYIAVICMAIVMNGKSIIWGDFLSQAGYPMEESKVNVLTVFCNIVFNIVLIVGLGTMGAAVATGMSYFVYGVLMYKNMIRKTGIKI
ncbi:hypothetical protein C808_00913 [Lachnospiraceae bacterium M18-1]|nr:hypothetical protein C808_00913 [Lachnospiraceae bacterium M18-1]